jgi:hypothetical protein
MVPGRAGIAEGKRGVGVREQPKRLFRWARGPEDPSDPHLNCKPILNFCRSTSAFDAGRPECTRVVECLPSIKAGDRAASVNIPTLSLCTIPFSCPGVNDFDCFHQSSGFAIQGLPWLVLP